jgi:anthranilate synthase component 1
VADSVPQSEWDETQNKAKAVLRAAELVQAGLDLSVDLSVDLNLAATPKAGY